MRYRTSSVTGSPLHFAAFILLAKSRDRSLRASVINPFVELVAVSAPTTAAIKSTPRGSLTHRSSWRL
ncbi:hypothetical protein K523DRAFT_104941 [Schizophyllum commune Tattone D]|nr:hypothetical protein K523DRAFT_104941 [Schizophyllum commune Tattone D]